MRPAAVLPASGLLQKPANKLHGKDKLGACWAAGGGGGSEGGVGVAPRAHSAPHAQHFGGDTHTHTHTPPCDWCKCGTRGLAVPARQQAGEGGWRRARATLPDVVHQRVFLLGPPSHAGPQVTVTAAATASMRGTRTDSAKVGSPGAG